MGGGREILKSFALVFLFVIFSLGLLRLNATLAILFKRIALTLDAKFKLFHNWSGFCFSPLLCFFRVVRDIFQYCTDYRYVYRYRLQRLFSNT